MGVRTRRSLALSWSALFVLSLLLQYFSFALASPALAVHDEGLFELDGNAVNQAAAGNDWDQVHAGTSSADQTKFITDAVNSTPDEHLFTGGGSKDGQDISNWKWTSGPGVQDKNDIEHAFAAAYTGGAGGAETFIYFGQDRYAQDGDAFVGFWFLKSAVSEKADGTFNGVHQDGDILVQADFTNGGVIQEFKVSKWLSGALHQVDTGLECPAANVPLADDSACGKVNGIGIGEIDSPWAYTPKSGTADKIPQGGFFEAGINLTTLGLDQGCFSTFVSETRSSQSLTSTLSDYAMGSFSFCTTPDISTQVKQGATSLGDNGNITIGESVTDVATLTGSKGTVTGTVDFFQCFSASATPDCTTGGDQVGGTKTLSGGIATSDAFTPDAVGHYCFRAEYHAAAGSKYLDVNHTNTTSECFDVVKKVPSIVTAAVESVSLGTEITDSATLSGATSDAGGSIVFRAYGPGDSNCSNTPAFTSAPVAVSGNGTYGPVSFTPADAGTYRWIASYSGDAKNAAKAGACNDAGENDTVAKLTPTIATQASASVTVGGTISDTATVSGGSSPTGTVTFVLYGPNDATCATAIFTSANRPLSGGSATSANFTTTQAGTYRWIATYNGDANNNAVTGACNDANESVVVTPAGPSIATSLVGGGKNGSSITVALGTSVHDTSTLSGATPTAGGTVQYQVFSDAQCSSLLSDAGTADVVNATPGDSNDVTFNHAGTFYWQADYSGDANNDPATSACNLEIVVVNQNIPTITTNASASVVIGGQIHDTATLAGGFGPTGSITFSLYGPDDATCASTAVFTSTVPVNGNGDYLSGSFTPATAGTYRWIAAYSGDADNAPVSGGCNDANENVIVTTPNLDVLKLVATNDDDFAPTSTALPGDVLNYQITVTNSGNGAATNVPVTDDIAAILTHATYNDDCSNACTLDGTTLKWTIPTLAANGGSVTLTFSVTLDATFPLGTTTLPNVVVVTGPGSNCAAESQDPDCDASTDVSTSRLVIAKSFTGNTAGTDPDLGVPAAHVGDTLHYTLAYEGGGTLTNAKITDVLPQGLAYVAGSAHGNTDFADGVYDPGTRTITWSALHVLSQDADHHVAGSVTYDVTVLATAPGFPQPLVNTATIVSDETAPDSATASVAVLPLPLELTPPPTNTLTPETGTSNPGFTLMLILLGVAGLALGIGFVTPTPERVRRRNRLG